VADEEFDDPSSTTRDRAARELARRARDVRAAEDGLRDAHLALAEELNRAHAAGLTWAEVADAAGLGSAQNARFRAQRGRPPEEQQPSFRWRAERGREPRPPRPESPGMSVKEAAERYDVTRQTIYGWIRAGRLKSVTDADGRIRILGDS
jgi:excisionase family DNA binding protein